MMVLSFGKQMEIKMDCEMVGMMGNQLTLSNDPGQGFQIYKTRHCR